MDGSLDNDFNKNNKIEINKIDPTPFTNKSSSQNNESNIPKKSLVKTTYTKFINSIKSLATKKNKEQNKNEIEPSNSNSEEPNQPPKTCKDKMAHAIISKVEVEKNITAFISLLGIGCFLICLSLLMLPLIITSPAKFSMCFGLGSVLVLISFLFYHGTKNYVLKLFEKKRFVITILFICSIFLGFIFSIGKHYFISLLCSLFQLISLILFVLTFIPGGKYGIRCIKNRLSSPFMNIFRFLV
jgi:cation transport ATPase